MSLRIAKSRGNKEAADKLTRLLNPFPELDLHYANAFTHPRMVLYTDAEPHDPQLALWGLVPAWVKDADQQRVIWNQTLNARGESIFEKPAFKKSARGRRAIVHVEGFYEHHHSGKNTYPYFIHLKDRPHFALAALWETWKDPNGGAPLLTFSIVTCDGNDLLKRIHNNPKLEGPRMPVILAEADEDLWLAPITSKADEDSIKLLISPYPAEAMTAHSVRPLLGKAGHGNAPGASEAFVYPELLLADPLR